MNVWVVRAETGEFANAFRSGGYVAIDYEISEKYPVGQGKEAYVEAFKTYNPKETNPRVIGQQVGQMIRFCEEIKAGDYVITPSEDTDPLYYGVVLDEPYYYEPKPTDECSYRHRRRVSWCKSNISRTALSAGFQDTLSSELTVFNVSHASEFLTVIDGDEGS